MKPADRNTGNDTTSLYRDVVKYAEMGDHRTGSPVDLLTSQWIHDRLTSSGLNTELDPWTLRQFQLQDCWVGVYGMQIDAVPLWHPTAAGEVPLKGQVVVDGDDNDVSGKIALVEFETNMVTPKSEHSDIITRLALSGAKAIIGCIPHANGEIFGPNVIPPHNQIPWPIPVVLIAPANWHILRNAAEIGDSVDFMLSGQDQPEAVAKNVIGKLERGPRWIVVSTPHSGWFRCAGERGSGVALMLELAEWAAQSDLDQSFLFLSSAGHEIGHLGIHNILTQDIPPSPEETDCWLHLGSSIATRAIREADGMLFPDGPDPNSWLFCSKSMQSKLSQTFKPHSHLNPEVYNRNHGEIRWILERGYDAFSLMGPNRFFHLQSDGPEAVDPVLLSGIAGTLKQTLSSLQYSQTSAA